MTIDERLEFLLQSTESLHATVHELSGTVHELSKSVQADGENIRALARIAEIHERPISDIEGSTDS